MDTLANVTWLDDATANLTPPFVVVDLDAFDANADDLVARAQGRPIRVASKSVRCRTLLSRVLDRPGFSGVMAYSVAEAIWLVEKGFRDIFVAYPSVDVPSLRRVAASAELRREITIAIDSIEHVEWLAAHVGGRLIGASPSGLGVALDVDASLRIGPAHLGVRRSPLRTAKAGVALARSAQRRGFTVRGVMFYDAQVAGLPDGGAHLRAMKARSVSSVRARRAEIVGALRQEVDVAFVNAGGTGSLHTFAVDDVVTELAAGSGLYAPTLFDGYDDFTPVPAMFFALPVVRRPARNIVTAYSGGYVASGPPGRSRAPHPLDPGLALLGTEMTGEVQTPLKGKAARALQLGDRVWMRAAKAGEVLERFNEVYLLRDKRLDQTTLSYRGEGKNFG